MQKTEVKLFRVFRVLRPCYSTNIPHSYDFLTSGDTSLFFSDFDMGYKLFWSAHSKNTCMEYLSAFRSFSFNFLQAPPIMIERHDSSCIKGQTVRSKEILYGDFKLNYARYDG